MNFRQNGVVIPTRRSWVQRVAPVLAGALLVGPFVLLGMLVYAALQAEPDSQAFISSAEGAAFEAGQALARDEMAHWVADAYEQGRRDARDELAKAQAGGTQ